MLAAMITVIQGYGHDLHVQRPNMFPGLCTKAELVWFNVVLYSCLCVTMQLDLSSVTTFVQYCVYFVYLYVPCQYGPACTQAHAARIPTLCTLTIKYTCSYA